MTAAWLTPPGAAGFSLRPGADAAILQIARQKYMQVISEEEKLLETEILLYVLLFMLHD